MRLFCFASDFTVLKLIFECLVHFIISSYLITIALKYYMLVRAARTAPANGYDCMIVAGKVVSVVIRLDNPYNLMS